MKKEEKDLDYQENTQENKIPTENSGNSPPQNEKLENKNKKETDIKSPGNESSTTNIFSEQSIVILTKKVPKIVETPTKPHNYEENSNSSASALNEIYAFSSPDYLF